MPSMIDPYLYIYAVIGLVILLVCYIAFSVFTEGVRAVYTRVHEAERKRRIEEWERKRTKN